MKFCLMMILLTCSPLVGMDLKGTWLGSLPSEQGEAPYVIVIEIDMQDRVVGRYHSHEHHGKMKAHFKNDLLDASIDFGGGVVFKGLLTVGDGKIAGKVHSEALNLTFPIEARRSKVHGLAAIGIEKIAFDQPIPHRVYRDDLPKKISGPVAKRIERHRREKGVVGLATAVLHQGRIADLRVYGWEDYAAKVSVSDKTMFRWASIAKPLTAIAAMQLVEAGTLELDRDVRQYVPEFPTKPWPVTSRQLLKHRSGMVHYQPGKVIVTERTYKMDHPFTDRILALDKFKESALLFQPDTDFSYSTPGYALLGAVIQRAGKGRYEDQVREGILAPLGMGTMQPDYPRNAIAHRTTGYKTILDGVTIPSGDSDVSWKLAAGGWISNISDLARFAEGILARKLLSEKTWEFMWTKPIQPNGQAGTYGYGFNLTSVHGARTVFHTGAQRKTSTIMMLCPDRQLGVVVMSNTEGVRHEQVSLDLLKILLSE